jgi:DNA-binding NtrC family response regulator
VRARLTLLVDAQKTRPLELKKRLLDHGFNIVESAGLQESFSAGVERFALILVVCDENCDQLITSGIRLCSWRPPVFILAEQSSERLAIAALKAGASDYFQLPDDDNELLAAIRKIVSEPNGSATQAAGPLDDSQPFVGQCPAIRNLMSCVKRAAASDCNVLITGETGTGKELVAALIHRYSPRRVKPFVCVNCAAIPDTLLESELFGHERGAFTGANSRVPGKFASGDGGTVFLDEIGEMSLCGQSKVLRMIESKEIQRLGSHDSVPVNIRVVAATNKNLEMLVEKNAFRSDLYFRLSVVSISLPPLRERGDDVAHLLHHYVKVLNHKYDRQVQGFTKEALNILTNYVWPGNVRELKNVLESIYVNGARSEIEAVDLPQKILHSTAGYSLSSDRERLTRTLQVCNWNKSKAAEQLNWSRMTIYRKMALYGIKAGSSRGADDASYQADVESQDL